MRHFPSHLAADEAEIIARLIDYALGHPTILMLRVHDGEDWATDWTRSTTAIQQAIAKADMTRVYVMKVAESGSVQRMGSILLIHGNGEDVISDSSHNPRAEGAEELIEAICNHANYG